MHLTILAYDTPQKALQLVILGLTLHYGWGGGGCGKCAVFECHGLRYQ